MIGRYLDPESAFAEILFGLIMALTFTLGVSLTVGASAEGLNEIIYGTVTCNVAWGLIDAVFYILAEVFELGRRGMRIKHVQTALTKEEGTRDIRELFDERIVPITTPEERERIYAAVRALMMRMEAPKRRPTREGLIGALIVFILVSSTSLPVLLPALLLPSPLVAVRVGNFLLVSCLFVTGSGMARAFGGHSIRFRLIMAGLGLVLVGVAKVLGG